MADEVAQQEDAEIDALLSLLEEGDEKGYPPASLESLDTPYGSDDEEYDNIFLGVILQKEYEHIFSSQAEECRSSSRHDKADDTEKRENDMMDMT